MSTTTSNVRTNTHRRTSAHTLTRWKNDVRLKQCHEQKTTKNHDQFSFDKQRVWKRISLHRWTKSGVCGFSEITTQIFFPFVCSFFNRWTFSQSNQYKFFQSFLLISHIKSNTIILLMLKTCCNCYFSTNCLFQEKFGDRANGSRWSKSH